MPSATMVVGVFDDHASAERALQALREAGIEPARIGVAAPQRSATGGVAGEPSEHHGDEYHHVRFDETTGMTVWMHSIGAAPNAGYAGCGNSTGITSTPVIDAASRTIFLAGVVNNGGVKQEIHALSGGIPRLINTLATTALLDAFGDDAATIDPPRVVSAARDHRMEAHG